MFMKFIIGKYVVYSGEKFYPIIKNVLYKADTVVT